MICVIIHILPSDNKLAKLRRCVSQVQFGKYTLEKSSLKAVGHSFQKKTSRHAVFGRSMTHVHCPETPKS